jgi:hypothetical protein
MALSGAERIANFRARRRVAHEDTAYDRAAYTAARFAADRGEFHSPTQMAKSLWPDDPTTPIITRAATAPASTTTSGWASDLALPQPGPFLESLGPLSAAAQLIAAGQQINLRGTTALAFPKRLASIPASDVTWAGQGSPVGVRNLPFDTVAIGPNHKLATASALTHELVMGGDGQSIVSLVLREDIGMSLDASLFSSTQATVDRPGGILYGLTSLGATAGGGESAMLGDLEKLASSIAASGNVAYIMSPKQYVSAQLRLGTNRPQTIWPSASLAAGTVVAIEPAAFICALGALRIEASEEATFHLDTAPQQISTGGTMAQGGDVRSAWQTDLIVILAILECTWGMRGDGLVAFISGATWGA